MLVADHTSNDIRISAQPFYAPEHSDPDEGRYVWTYQMRIENVGGEPAQLLWRQWLIHDPAGGDQEVEGEGVLGETPTVRPGETYEYQSFCVLEGPEGHMEGSYQFRRPDGSRFQAAIPRFLLRIYAA